MTVFLEIHLLFDLGGYFKLGADALPEQMRNTRKKIAGNLKRGADLAERLIADGWKVTWLKYGLACEFPGATTRDELRNRLDRFDIDPALIECRLRDLREDAKEN